MSALLVGGAQMFEFESRMAAGSNSSVGLRNDAAVREALAAEGIPISGSETGGVSGRSMRISPGSTWVSVFSSQDRQKTALDALTSVAATRATISITPRTRGNANGVEPTSNQSRAA